MRGWLLVATCLVGCLSVGCGEVSARDDAAPPAGDAGARETEDADPPDDVASTCVPAPGDLVAWWRAEGNGNDSAGSNDAEPREDPAFDDGHVGRGMQLDGNDALLVGAADALYPQESFSIEVWLRTEQTNLRALLDHSEQPREPGGVTCQPKGCRSAYGLHIDGGTPRFTVRSSAGNESGDPEQQLEGQRSVADGNYHHIVAVRSTETMQLLLYVDGELDSNAELDAVATGPLEPGLDGGEVDPLVMGARRANDGLLETFLTGSLDEVSYYDRALTADEIAELHAAGSAGKCP
jgi:Concanavalin A-like lectin/glucanases superfamily